MKCPNCKHKVLEKKTNIGVLHIYKCKKCGLQFILGKEIQSKPNEYENLLNSVKSVRVHNHNLNLVHINQIFTSDKIRGFEVGCATGLFMKMAEKQGIEMVGIEPMEASYRIAKKNGLNVLNGYFPQDMPKGIGKFDFIIFNDVFEHINGSKKILLSCMNYLKVGGI